MNNSLILIIGIFTWHYVLFFSANVSGTLAVAIADILQDVCYYCYQLSRSPGISVKKKSTDSEGEGEQ